MHDPMVVVCDLPRDIATVWHVEPGGADAGDVCGHPPHRMNLDSLRWVWRHRAHIEVHWTHYRRVHRWLYLRCAECGQPFRGRYRERSGYIGDDNSYHRHCMDLRGQRGQADLFARFIVLGTDEWNAKYHAGNRLGIQGHGF